MAWSWLVNTDVCEQSESRCEGDAPADHARERVVLLDNLYGRGVGDFRVFGHLDATEMDASE